MFTTPNPNRILIKGIITTLVGIAMIAIPDLSIDMAVKFIGIMFIADGLISFLPAIFKNNKQSTGFISVPKGSGSLFLGILLLLIPQLIVGFFVFMAGFVLIIIGGSILLSQIAGKNVIGFSWVLTLISIIALIAGIILLLNPFKGAITIIIFLGVIIILIGLGEISWSFRMRKHLKNSQKSVSQVVDIEYEEVE